jgi:CheY-like chemotaxis protein
VRRLAELHGGSVSVESEIGKGSRFVIALPYPPPELVDAKSPSSAFPFKGSTTLHSAVVIEDSETAGEQLARYLQELRIHAIVHPKGEGALEQVVNSHPDVIFLDLQMPGQSGWDVLAQLKADPRLQTIPVIIVSVVDDRARGLAAGAAEYLVKPISRETLRHALGIVVAGPEVAREALIIAAQTTISPLNVRILLVEDNEVNIIAIGDYLHDRGYCVVIARNGREALDVIAEARPDIILMDIQMPEMDGLEATRRLRGMPTYKTTPIIALTALAMPGDRERCIAAGVTEYLTKPVSLKGLVDIIQRLLTA